MLLANMAKDDKLQRVLELKRDVPKELSTSAWAIDQLLDCFVKGAEGGYNKDADFDYLSYFFADLAKVGDIFSWNRRSRLTMLPVPQRARILHHTTTPRLQHHPPNQTASLHLTPLAHPPPRCSIHDKELRLPHSLAPDASLQPLARPNATTALNRRKPATLPSPPAHGSRGV